MIFIMTFIPKTQLSTLAGFIGLSDK